MRASDVAFNYAGSASEGGSALNADLLDGQDSNAFIKADQILEASKVCDDVFMYMTIQDEVQGTIQGGVTQAGHAGSLEVCAFEHGVISPRDAASGLPTGKRQHQPLTIVKSIDRATPLLYNALIGNNNLTNVDYRVVEAYLYGSGGTIFHHYSAER